MITLRLVEGTAHRVISTCKREVSPLVSEGTLTHFIQLQREGRISDHVRVVLSKFRQTTLQNCFVQPNGVKMSMWWDRVGSRYFL